MKSPVDLDNVFDNMNPAIIIGVHPINGSVVVMFLAPQVAIEELTLTQMGEQYAEFLGDVFFQLAKSCGLTYEHLEKICHTRSDRLAAEGKTEEVYAHDVVKNYRKFN